MNKRQLTKIKNSRLAEYMNKELMTDNEVRILLHCKYIISVCQNMTYNEMITLAKKHNVSLSDCVAELEYTIAHNTKAVNMLLSNRIIPLKAYNLLT